MLEEGGQNRTEEAHAKVEERGELKGKKRQIRYSSER
jgi:hypothetical protein